MGVRLRILKYLKLIASKTVIKLYNFNYTRLDKPFDNKTKTKFHYKH